MITVNNLSETIKNQPILYNLSAKLTPGRITIFIGKSGAGKTTLLKSLVGLVPAYAGEIIIDGNSLSILSSSERSKAIGFVFQDFNLFPHMTVLQNCIDPLIVQGISFAVAQERACQILTTLQMNDFTEKYPDELSGGQQRIAIARALCLKPQVLLLDEPTASLDPINTEILIAILQNLAQKGLTIGVSSQDMSFVRKIFDRVYFMLSGDITEFCDNKNVMKNFDKIKKFCELIE